MRELAFSGNFNGRSTLAGCSVGDGFAVTDALKVEGVDAMKQVEQEGCSCKAMKPPAPDFPSIGVMATQLSVFPHPGLAIISGQIAPECQRHRAHTRIRMCYTVLLFV